MDAQLPSALLAASADAVREPRAGGSRAEGCRPDGWHNLSQHRAAHRPFVHSKIREATQRRTAEKLQAGLETAYCAETVAITYEEMGLLTTEKHSNWFDAGSFWSGDSLPLAPGHRLSDEIAILP